MLQTHSTFSTTHSTKFFHAIALRHSFRRLFYVAVLLIALSGCAMSNDDGDRNTEVLFEVNGVERTVYDFEKSYVEHLIKTGRHDSRSERNSHLNKMIDDILLSQSAATSGLLDHDTYRSAIKHQQRKSMLDTYFVDQMEQEIDPLTEEDIRLAYAKRQRTVYVRQLFSKNPADLDSAWQALESGEDFVDVANRFYKTPRYDSLAGYLGPIRYFGVDDDVAEAAYSIAQGAYTPPIRSRLGYHILFAERIEFPAILTEDEFQYRKDGVQSQLRLRRQRMISSSYVYDVMNQLDVQTNREAILLLRDAIQNLDADEAIIERTTPESEDGVWTDNRVKTLADRLNPDLVLATFTIEGVPNAFTFRQYIDWLPYLSFQESKHRIGASVGRGMRNQVLYERAEAQGYEQDERVKKAIQIRATEILSQLLQYQLTMDAVHDTQKVNVPETFLSRYISSRDILLKADYWKVTAKTLNEAQEISDRIIQGEDPVQMKGYTYTKWGVIDETDSDYNLVTKSVIRTPIISYSGDQGWFVLYVEDRETEEVGVNTKIADLEGPYKVYKTIRSEVDSLRASADLEINTELFEEIYQVWSPVQSDS